jgi:hypothetical protein
MDPNKERAMGDWIKELLEASTAQADLQLQERRSVLARAVKLKHEIEAFESRWPASTTTADQIVPAFSWSQLERQLADLADTPVKAAMARDMVSATRKLSRFKPPEMVLREILCMTWALLDEDFQPLASDSTPMP